MLGEFDVEDEARTRKRAGNYYLFAIVLGAGSLTVYMESMLPGVVFGAGGIALLSVVNSFHVRLEIISQRLKSIDRTLADISQNSITHSHS